MKRVQSRSAQGGFTLIELLIVVAIIGILAAIAVPAYQTYTKKAKFAEVINAVSPFKLSVEACYVSTSDLTACDAGTNGVQAARTTADGFVSSVSVTDGVITATGTAAVDDKTYVLTPTAGSGNVLNWSRSTTSTCIDAGLC